MTYYAATLPQSLLLQLLSTPFYCLLVPLSDCRRRGLTEPAVCCFHIHVKEDTVTQRRDNSPVAVARFLLFNALMSHPVSSVPVQSQATKWVDVTFSAGLEKWPELVLK